MTSQLNDFKNLKENLGLWPILTVFILLLGYIGFYTYCSINRIPFPIPDISLIAGIGIYNFIAILLMYNPKKRNINPSFINAITITIYLNFLSINPIILASIILLDIQSRVFGFDTLIFKKKKKSITELRKLVETKLRRKIKLYIAIYIALILLTLFVNENIWMTIVAVYFISKLYYFIKIQKPSNYFILFFISLSIPIFTAQNHFTNIDYTILGLSKEYSEVSTSKSKYKGIITFKSTNNLYLKTYSKKGKENIIIPTNQIQKIIILDTIIKPQTGIEYLKNKIEYLKNN